MTDPTPTLRELFETALAMAPAQRAAFLHTHCRDAAQRSAVERLLAADEDGGARVLDHPFDELLDQVGAAEPEGVLPPAGTRVGPFTLVDKLGEGGSSIVFRAEREQAGVRQRSRSSCCGADSIPADEQRRFRDERRALAQLQHPGIARLIEGGITDAGAAVHRARTDRRRIDHRASRARSASICDSG